VRGSCRKQQLRIKFICPFKAIKEVSVLHAGRIVCRKLRSTTSEWPSLAYFSYHVFWKYMNRFG
jgi:hypothetical protein